ncbi:Vps53-like protein [Mycena floridula]|nr:Vps53-like protein [Mycena floridula]
MSSEELPTELLVAIDHVLASDTPLIDTLNSFFPNEASLAHTETVQRRLQDTQREIQREIDALQLQLRQNQDPNRMQLIQDLISELLTQMSRIREKATESEAVVRNITKDIQVLDLAKKNLILSMTTLKRLQMLVNALTQLEDLVQEKKYSEIAQTLAAVTQISETFKPYLSVPRVAQVWKRIQELQGEIRVAIDADFDSFFLQDTSKQLKPAMMADACLVVDVLGTDVRAHLIERYSAFELKEYRRIFRTSDEAGQLDNISRRFAWFRRLLQTHEVEQGRVFPVEWRVGWYLFAKFSDITREDMATLLSKAGSSLTVKSLLDNLQITTEFETSMSRKWATSLQVLLSSVTPPPKSISSAFDKHMGVFIDAQGKALADMLAPHRKGKFPQPRVSMDTSRSSIDAEEAASSEAPIVVLPSSTELFYFYGQSLDQCAKLSTGKPLFDLGNLHKKWLKIYAEDVLLANLKRPPPQTSRKSMDTRAEVIDLQQVTLFINTADYCQTTALELEEKIREKVDGEYKDKITFQPERDLFVSVISSAITLLLRDFESACDPAFLTMSRTSWPALNQVTGQSAYITDLIRSAEKVLETIKPLIEQKKYLRNLFDKACSLLLAKFTNALVKSRPLKEIGAEQLLIDLSAVKSFLLQLPGDSLASSSYTRGLAKSTTRLESLLKVIVTPVDPPEGFILNYTLLIGDASFSNFQKILDLKGTPKAEQNDLLDSFLTITSTKDDLESTSFLSSLDMDPPTLGLLGTLASPMGSQMGSSTDNVTSIFSGLASPPVSGPPTGSSMTGDPNRQGSDRQVFSDFRRFVSFGLRRDPQA